MSTEITVRGRFSVFQPPERATVHTTVAYEGPEMAPVYQRVAHDLETLTASVEELTDGPVTRWSAEQLRTSSTRPWNQDGEQLPLVHHASVSVDVEFRDFTALSRWIGRHVAEVDGFRVSRVEWALTEEHLDELRTEVRRRAVLDAADRAQQYADALDLGAVRPVAIADAGMLGALSPDGGPGQNWGVMAAARSSAPVVEFVPEDIEVSAAVDARFAAGAI